MHTTRRCLVSAMGSVLSIKVTTVETGVWGILYPIISIEVFSIVIYLGFF